MKQREILGVTTVKKTFNNYSFSIPNLQRKFEWNIDHVSQFMQDLLEDFEKP